MTVNVSGSYSGKTDLDAAGQQLGDIAVTSFKFEAASSSPLGDRCQFGYGLEYTHFGLDGSAAAPLPDTLQSIALPLSVGGPLAPGWIGRVIATPGLYGSNLEFSGRDANVPLAAFAAYRQSPRIAWTFGLRYDAWSKYPLLPLAGVNWRFAPDWELSVGLPRTGVSWQFHPDAALRFGASFQGGSFYVHDDAAAPSASRPYLGQTKLDYREIRVGVALDLFPRSATSVVLDAGAIVNQRFDYDRSDFKIDGSSAPYVALSARFRF